MFKKSSAIVLVLLFVLATPIYAAFDDPAREPARLRDRDRGGWSSIVKVIKTVRGGITTLSDLLGGPKP